MLTAGVKTDKYAARESV